MYISLDRANIIPLYLPNPKFALKYFLPHHCVILRSNETSEFFFHASTKTATGYEKFSQKNYFDILCRFRLFPFILITDIKKMYLVANATLF